MKLIEVLNKLENYELPNKTKFKWRDNIVINKKGTLYYNDMFFSKILNFANAEALKEELEIIKEPKEELEEIKLIEVAGCNIKILGSFFPTENMINDILISKINKLIANQNKIVRELKDKKGN